ncbi:PIN domain-containing protein [Chiayiivirga flava]|uniref:Ribonuclease VapC n=1 Tax=Chiayiivirga flava TaxID=659595 RepID=A0A7W8D840_9GAMM|nr:PIN domain-containing protein [Chiayiivirga flava]MBB5209620.1 tRNA(fMet)-specific endonuclease VapC [Chiayiivirga flava]
MLALDTNTVSYFFRDDPHVVPRMLALSPSDIVIPTVVAYELRYGLRRLPPEASAPRLEALEAFLMPLRIVPFDAGCAANAAAIRADLEVLGTPIGAHDVMIAATVRASGATLVTRNVREFSRVSGLSVVSWHPH